MEVGDVSQTRSGAKSGRRSFSPVLSNAGHVGLTKVKTSWCFDVVRVTSAFPPLSGYVRVGMDVMPYWHHASRTLGSQSR